jgi:hypothetical protein
MESLNHAVTPCASRLWVYRLISHAFEEPEIIWIVEQSHLAAKRALDQLGIARRTF